MYRIIIKKRAKKFIDKLPKQEKLRLVTAIEELPNGSDIKKMKGHDDLMRLRVGDYRVVYTVDNGELIVLVIDAGNRGEIYTDIERNGCRKRRRSERKALRGGQFSSLCFGNRYISPSIRHLTQPVGQTFVPHNRTAQPLLKPCYALRCLRPAMQCPSLLCLCLAPHCSSKPCLCCALLLKAMPLLC